MKTRDKLNSNNDHIEKVDKELWGMTFGYLDKKALSAARLACRFFYSCSFDPVKGPFYPPLDYCQPDPDRQGAFTFELSPYHPYYKMVPMSNDVIVFVDYNKLAVIDLKDKQSGVKHLINDSATPPFNCYTPISCIVRVSSKLIAGLQDGFLFICNIETGAFKTYAKPNRSFARGYHDKEFSHLAVSKDGTLVYGTGCTLFLFRSNEDKPFGGMHNIYYSSDNERIEHLFVNEYDQIITISNLMNMGIWTKDGTLLNTIEHIPLFAYGACLLPGNRLIGHSRDSSGRAIWNFGEKVTERCLFLEGEDVAFSDKSFTATTQAEIIISRGRKNYGPGNNCRGKGISVWDMSTGQCLAKLPHKNILSFAIMPDRRLITQSDDGLLAWHFPEKLALEDEASPHMRNKL